MSGTEHITQTRDRDLGGVVPNVSRYIRLNLGRSLIMQVTPI